VEPNESYVEPQPFKERHIRDGCAWCWQSKETLKTIGEIFDATNDTSSARSVYLALTQIASDEQSESFTKPIGEIARRAGVSYRTAARILSRFEAIRILRVDRNLVEGTKEHSASTYTLGNGCSTSGNDRNRPSLPKVQKNLRTIFKKKVQKNAAAVGETQPAKQKEAAAAAAISADSDELFVKELRSVFPEHDVFHQYDRYCRFCKQHNHGATRPGFVAWMKRALSFVYCGRRSIGAKSLKKTCCESQP